jgi:hypothetical protein
MHSIFAQIEQQRAEHDHERLQRQDAKQPGERFGHDAHQKRRDTAMTKKYQKHVRLPLSENPRSSSVRAESAGCANAGGSKKTSRADG